MHFFKIFTAATCLLLAPFLVSGFVGFGARRMTFRLGDTAADVISDGPPRALVLGLGFAQFLVVRTLA
eukprot:CAMPEP_0194286144 /NCGR_PEP_ID=MMETSP0169-20130528/31943_1 /TAXON_ID=218684 /ORGANISM="Corethron pennatum, Strain L29A3" /LENGTH=67 /DNA_ID=CAMNT_0039032491 /DNA_START=64 /DNA_END=264 /DNA_ORIENTATION=+